MMVEGYVGPSELHLKKELTVLRKSRFLRDPETCSSYRSPLSSKSLAASSAAIPNGHMKTNPTPKSSINVLPKSKNKHKKVYLYNWRHQSVKSSESGFKTGEEEDESLAEESLSESKSETYHEYNVMGSNAGTPVRKTVRRVKRYAGPRKCATRLETPVSAEQSDDCRPGGYLSRTGSPFFSGSCGSWSNPAKILKNMRREGSSLSCTPVSTSSYYGAGASFDGDELLDRKGCGIFSRKANFYSQSPSLSDTLRKKSSGLLCGSNSVYSNSNHSRKRYASNKRRHLKSNASPGLPLLATGGVDSPFDSESDEISTNFGELDLEAVSRLDGRRWSTSCKSYDGFEIGLNDKVGLDLEQSNQRSLSQKYQPRAFEEIVGQNIVTQSLSNAILRGKITPAYLFQGPRGTGKTSTARIFAAALSCMGPTKEIKPCGMCNECMNVGKNLIEVDATNKSKISKVRNLVKTMPADVLSTRYTVFVIDECHMVSTKMWSAFMKLLEEPMSHIVFIFITIDPDNIPRAIISRCQRYIFSKIKEVDMVCRLRKISVQERLDVDLDALDLIALNSDGSLRDAETMLDQLSLLGKKITTSLVNDLVGVVPDEKLFDLLELAMSADTAETVKRSRELMDSGVDPMALMSQLAGLIMDIIAGTYGLANSRSSGTALGGRRLTEAELERLQQALKILSDAEKQIRLSSERSTWFTAALLQLGSSSLSDTNQSRTSSKKSARTGTNSNKEKPRVESSANTSNCSPSEKRAYVKSESEEKLGEIWRRCIEKCHLKTLRQLLFDHGKLVSINEDEGVLIACIAFEDSEIKSRAERYLSSITNSIETVLKRNVKVRMGVMSDSITRLMSRSGPGSSFSRGNPNTSDGSSQKRLENAWLQAGMASQPKPEKNQVLPQNSGSQSKVQLDEEISREIKALNIGGEIVKEQGENGFAMSPSLLHSKNYTTNLDKEKTGYESGSAPGCNGLLCWRTQRSRDRKVRQGVNVSPRKNSSSLSHFGPCGKSKPMETRLNA
ncbi:DNA polymerase III subunit gamma/tau [Rhynchospora pubera]|uniref:DNA polymerase III subunit gamma/tau n=1 Tax=Rhynchospora pubera TaxID=906938 RepID=A0AAV8FQZ9_9POAL|nr:DNA polymerase III subunit gamma/tau [Rhynchospora pubera]